MSIKSDLNRPEDSRIAIKTVFTMINRTFGFQSKAELARMIVSNVNSEVSGYVDWWANVPSDDMFSQSGDAIVVSTPNMESNAKANGQAQASVSSSNKVQDKSGGQSNKCPICGKGVDSSKKSKDEPWSYPDATTLKDAKEWADSGYAAFVGRRMHKECRTTASREANKVRDAFFAANPTADPKIAKIKEELAGKKTALEAATTTLNSMNDAAKALEALPADNAMKVQALAARNDAKTLVDNLTKEVSDLETSLSK